MNTLQLQQVLTQDYFTQKYFMNVYPCDQLPTEIQSYPTCFISNVDSSTEPGSHWLAFYLPSEDEIEFFDSYGNPPSFFRKEIMDFVSRYSKMDFNPMTLQSTSTAVCGQYCIFYLYCRCRGQPPRKILSNFITNHMCNDRQVYNFVAKKFNVYPNFYQ